MVTRAEYEKALRDVLDAWDAYMLGSDKRTHVDNPTWLNLCYATHRGRLTLHGVRHPGSAGG